MLALKNRAMVAAIGAVAALAAAGCGDDEEKSASGSDGKTTSITVATPFPGCSSLYPIYAAIDQGYFDEEGLDVKVEPLEGSGGVLAAVSSGKAQVGVASPGPFLQQVEKGSDLKSFYTLSQGEVYSLVVPEDSDIKEVADLKGKKVGISAPNSGSSLYAESMLGKGGGLKEGDYELVDIGGGGPAAVAIERDDIDAYSDSYVDVEIMRQRGLKLRALTDEDYPEGIDSVNVAESGWVDDNEDALRGYVKAIQKATDWGHDGHEEDIVELCGKIFPDESSDKEFALALMDEIFALEELPDEADGKNGYQPPAAVKASHDFLVEQGTLKAPVDLDVFTNEYL